MWRMRGDASGRVPNRHITHPMREDVKRKHFSTALRETWIGACIQAPCSSWRGFWFERLEHHRVRPGYGSQLLVSTSAVSCNGPDAIRCEAAQAKRWP